MSENRQTDITQEYMNNTIDNLIIAHFLQTYDVRNIYEVDISIIQNPLDLSLIDLILQRPANNLYNYRIQTVCQENAEELIVEFECAICMEYKQTIEKITFNCQHNMCKDCARKCIYKKTICPFCRGTIKNVEVKDPAFVHEF
uniref:RING-type domain-containing protein n=1 Tax=viral metagenome TaxID=1070528 RepID=A0A6C0HZE0_9ZZZZ